MERRDGDYMNELIRYVENNLKSGYREDQLRFLLINQGYSRSAVEKALRIAAQNRPPVEAPKAAEPAKVEYVAEPMPEKKPGLFSRLFGGFFSSKKKSQPQDEPSMPQAQDSGADGDFVQIDSEGNIVK